MRKSAQIINLLPDSSLPECRVKLDCFTSMTCDELSPLVRKIATISCSLDPIPANVLKNCFDTLLPVITRIVNALLRCSEVPDSLKSTVLVPALKNRYKRSMILAVFALFQILNSRPRQ